MLQLLLARLDTEWVRSQATWLPSPLCTGGQALFNLKWRAYVGAAPTRTTSNSHLSATEVLLTLGIAWQHMSFAFDAIQRCSDEKMFWDANHNPKPPRVRNLGSLKVASSFSLLFPFGVCSCCTWSGWAEDFIMALSQNPKYNRSKPWQIKAYVFHWRHQTSCASSQATLSLDQLPGFISSHRMSQCLLHQQLHVFFMAVANRTNRSGSWCFHHNPIQDLWITRNATSVPGNGVTLLQHGNHKRRAIKWLRKRFRCRNGGTTSDGTRISVRMSLSNDRDHRIYHLNSLAHTPHIGSSALPWLAVDCNFSHSQHHLNWILLQIIKILWQAKGLIKLRSAYLSSTLTEKQRPHSTSEWNHSFWLRRDCSYFQRHSN